MQAIIEVTVALLLHKSGVERVKRGRKPHINCQNNGELAT